MLQKLQYTLAEVAVEWSRLTGRTFTENDILKIAADTLLPFVLLRQGIKLSLQHIIQHPSLSLHYYTSTAILTLNENGQADGAFLGRLFIDAVEVNKIIRNGYVEVYAGYDTDTMCVFHFLKPVIVTSADLVITNLNKTEFEAKYLGVQHD